MEDSIKLEAAIKFIVIGLYEKEKQKIEGEYFYSAKLIHGINIFSNLSDKYNSKHFDFGKMHEQKFITEYAIKPISQWFAEWENTEELELEKQDFYYVDALVSDAGFYTYCISSDCEDYIEYIKRDIIGDTEQRLVYNNLKLLNQEEYVDLRKYFIEHPVISQEELRKLKQRYSENDIAIKAIENAYEEVKGSCYICPNCGWAIQKEKVGIKCPSCFYSEVSNIPNALKSISANLETLRLKRGVMKYMAVPGQLEMEIYNYCKKYKIESEL